MLELFGHPVEQDVFVPMTEPFMEETLKQLRHDVLQNETFEWLLTCQEEEVEPFEKLLQTFSITYEKHDARANIQMYDFHLKGLSNEQMKKLLTLDMFRYVKVGGLFIVVAGTIEIEYEIDDLGCCFTEGIPVLYLEEDARAFVVSHDLYGYTIVESL